MTDDMRYEAAKIEASRDIGVRITWTDDHISHWDLAAIRGACGCATCHELRHAGRPVWLGDADSLDVSDAELVGAYGITFHWSDGHATGIYTWTDLRDACPCDECRTSRRVDGKANPLDR